MTKRPRAEEKRPQHESTRKHVCGQKVQDAVVSLCRQQDELQPNDPEVRMRLRMYGAHRDMFAEEESVWHKFLFLEHMSSFLMWVASRMWNGYYHRPERYERDMGYAAQSTYQHLSDEMNDIAGAL